jgi:hypothetical protein
LNPIQGEFKRLFRPFNIIHTQTRFNKHEGSGGGGWFRTLLATDLKREFTSSKFININDQGAFKISSHGPCLPDIGLNPVQVISSEKKKKNLLTVPYLRLRLA